MIKKRIYEASDTLDNQSAMFYVEEIENLHVLDTFTCLERILPPGWMEELAGHALNVNVTRAAPKVLRAYEQK